MAANEESMAIDEELQSTTKNHGGLMVAGGLMFRLWALRAW